MQIGGSLISFFFLFSPRYDYVKYVHLRKMIEQILQRWTSNIFPHLLAITVKIIKIHIIPVLKPFYILFCKRGAPGRLFVDVPSALEQANSVHVFDLSWIKNWIELKLKLINGIEEFVRNNYRLIRWDIVLKISSVVLFGKPSRSLMLFIIWLYSSLCVNSSLSAHISVVLAVSFKYGS